MQITIQKQDKRNVLLMLLLSLLLQGLKLALAHLPNESINQKWYSGLKINEYNFKKLQFTIQRFDTPV